MTVTQHLSYINNLQNSNHTIGYRIHRTAIGRSLITNYFHLQLLYKPVLLTSYHKYYTAVQNVDVGIPWLNNNNFANMLSD